MAARTAWSRWNPSIFRRVTSFADMLRRMSRTAFGGRELGEAFEVLQAMAADPECTIVVTISGAMTVAKMGRSAVRDDRRRAGPRRRQYRARSWHTVCPRRSAACIIGTIRPFPISSFIAGVIIGSTTRSKWRPTCSADRS